MEMEMDSMETDPMRMDMDPQAEKLDVERCEIDANEVVDYVFNQGYKFHPLYSNASFLSNNLYQLAYADGCQDRCKSCAGHASYVRRVRNDGGRYLTIPGTAQDAFLFFFLALFLGCLFAAHWRWVGPRTRRWTKWFTMIPHTISVLIAGSMCFLLAHFVNLTQFSNSFAWWLNVNPPELLFYALLPVLLFDAAMRVQWFYFRKAFISIIVFAVAMVVLNSLLTGIFMQHAIVPIAGALGLKFRSWNIYNGLTMGAILGSTDPVSVISFLEANNAPEMLATVIGGESLFNDASSYILFQAFLLNAMETFESVSPGQIVANILYAGAVGLFVGCGCGLLLTVIIRSLYEQKTLETNFTVVFAYLSFYLSQGVLNASGPVAVTTCGLFMAAMGLPSVSPKARDHLLSFWEIIVFIGNMLIFFYSGCLAMSLLVNEAFQLYTSVYDVNDDKLSVNFNDATPETTAVGFVGSIFVGMPLIYVSQYLLRGLWIACFYPFMNFVGFKKKTPGTAIFLNFCALRGGINLIMVLIVAQTSNVEIPPTEKFFMSIWSTGFVLMTLLINGPLIPLLMRVTKVSGGSIIKDKMFARAKKALHSFTLDAIKQMEMDASLLSADVAKILKAAENILDLAEESDKLAEAATSRRKENESNRRHYTQRNLSFSPSSPPSPLLVKREVHSSHCTWFFNENCKADSIFGIQRRSYELSNASAAMTLHTLPKLRSSRSDQGNALAEYCHLVTTMRAAGLNTLTSEITRSNSNVMKPEIQNLKDTIRDKSITRTFSEVYETVRFVRHGTVEKFFRSFDTTASGDAAAKDEELNFRVPQPSTSRGAQDEEELRVKFIVGLKRHFRRERTNGKIGPAELQWLEDACNRASHNCASPLDLWSPLESKLWVANLEMRHKTFNQTRKAPLLLKYVQQPLTVWWFSRGMKLACMCALTFLDAVRSVGDHNWVHAFSWLHQEVEREISLVEEFIYQLRLDEPDLVQSVQTYRGTRYLGQMMIEFVRKLHHSGLIEEHDVEKLVKPIGITLRNQTISLSYLPRFNSEIVKSLAFCQVLSPNDYSALVLRKLKYYSVKKGESIVTGGGMHIVLQGVVSCFTTLDENTKVKSLLGNGATLCSLCQVMTSCKDDGHIKAYAYSSVVHLACLDAKVSFHFCLPLA